MKIFVQEDPAQLGIKAGVAAAQIIDRAIREKGEANIILATGTSQYATLNQLVLAPDVDWSRVTMFHLDEYIGLPEHSPASFRRYLKERFISKVSSLKAAYLIDGMAEPIGECKRIGDLISKHPIDLALVGIGENGHLAFNDPPADFETEAPYIIVELDEACRKQQMGEGWFHGMEDVPTRAISMSIRQIMKSIHIICSVPDERKAMAVKNCLEQPVNNLFPASILRLHAGCRLYLDKSSASLLSAETLAPDVKR